MYKVMIIDDEPIIAEGLSKIIPWSQWNAEVVAVAPDGLTGQTLIREKKPDLIISDICMPGQDGLNMIAALKSEFPDVEGTILTGYRDFDYAQRAIRLGVSRFLLKPSNLGELNEAVEAMVHNLKKKGIQPDRQEPSGKEESEEQKNAAGSFIVSNAVQYMQEHFQEKITLPEVAEKIYVSQWHLSKLLNRHMGKNFSEVLNSIRIEKAKELMKDPSLRLADIAEMVGFLDVAHFSRVFKKLTGVSAGEYRNHL